MGEKLREFGGRAKEVFSTAALLVGDLNSDGKVDQEDAKIAVERAKKCVSAIGDEAMRVGKETLRSDMVKDAAAGAAVGAAIAIPVPAVGPVTGAAIGAGLGVYKNIVKKGSDQTRNQLGTHQNVHSELLKFNDLKQKGIITEEEFGKLKNKILKDN